ncbi:MAG: LamG domain-containing protein [Kiritimatiellae bacterium]|nr:LamG domain-containing protein [Kiritimatiellia bacterium]
MKSRRSVAVMMAGVLVSVGWVWAGTYAESVLESGPTSYWRMNDASGSVTVADSATNLPLNPGSVVGTVYLGVPGALTNESGNTAMGDNAGGSVLVTNAEVGASFSLELWVKSATTNWNNWGNFLSSRVANGFEFGPTKDTKALTLYVANSSGALILLTSYTVPSDITQWHHYAMTYSDTAGVDNAKLYVDGVPVVNYNVTIARVADTLSSLYVGRGISGREFSGTLDEVAIYGRALGADEIARHYSALIERHASSYSRAVLGDGPTSYWRLDEPAGSTVVADYATNAPVTPGACIGTLSLGAAGALVDDAKNSAMSDAALGYVQVANAEIGASFSLELWAKSAIATWNNWGNLISSRVANGFEFGPAKGTKQLQFYVMDTNNALTGVIFYTPSDDITQWHHYVVTYQDVAGTDTAFMYMDGVQVATASPTVARAAATLPLLSVGCGSSGDRTFNGTLDECAIYSHVLSPDQVRLHYRVGLGWRGGTVVLVR